MSAKPHHAGADREPLNEGDLLEAAKQLVATSADLIAENTKLTGETMRLTTLTCEAVKRLDNLAARLDGEERQEALLLAEFLRGTGKT